MKPSLRQARAARLAFSALVALAAAALAGGCANTSAPQRFYTLEASALETPKAPACDWRIEVGPISIPQSIDRAELVEARSSTELAIYEQDRWAEPLAVGIGRVLAEALGRQTGASSAWAYPQRGVPDPSLHVSVDVQSLSAGRDSVVLEALWSVRSLANRPANCAAPAEAVTVGHAHLTEAVSAPGATGLVQAQSRIIAALAAQIAQGIAAARH